MAVTNGILLRSYDEHIHDGMRLGRHMELDARSLEHLIAQVVTPQPIKPREWPAAIPTLDQGQIGSCTGNAGTYHLATVLGAANLADVQLDGVGLTQGNNEPFAVALYHEATVSDSYPGTYPPDDTGSSGLGVCKALHKAGLIKRYVWGTSLNHIGLAFQRAGIIIGTPWYESWFNPDSDGFIDNGDWKASGVAGGHEIYGEALEAWDGGDPSKSIVRFHNSWGDGWGDHGCFRMRLSTYMTLKAEIDVKQFIV